MDPTTTRTKNAQKKRRRLEREKALNIERPKRFCNAFLQFAKMRTKGTTGSLMVKMPDLAEQTTTIPTIIIILTIIIIIISLIFAFFVTLVEELPRTICARSATTVPPEIKKFRIGPPSSSQLMADYEMRKPKRPLTGYQVFIQTYVNANKDKNRSQKSLFREGARGWNKLSEEERRNWVNKSKQMNEEQNRTKSESAKPCCSSQQPVAGAKKRKRSLTAASARSGQKNKITASKKSASQKSQKKSASQRKSTTLKKVASLDKSVTAKKSTSHKKSTSQKKSPGQKRSATSKKSTSQKKSVTSKKLPSHKKAGSHKKKVETLKKKMATGKIAKPAAAKKK
ncbi:hypothetical protein HELRODRAFT_188228 [Helobdella robusta]|uniref:HMG box domain-containing protein n=1 Tax=Helobdella robusta TaxID=6412 RepID=T1FPS6_HELRO|nr:hypothetical protein HELRODRAFT_188228 [Helobdella robusta]ESO05920.1 hypothetical protein HELRODRAFT_188228 [Helobdella robusta]